MIMDIQYIEDASKVMAVISSVETLNQVAVARKMVELYTRRYGCDRLTVMLISLLHDKTEFIKGQVN